MLPSLQDLANDSVRQQFYSQYYRLIAEAARRVGFPLNLSPDMLNPDDSLAFSLLCTALADYDPTRIGKDGTPVKFSSYLYKRVIYELARESDRRGDVLSHEDEWGWGDTSIDPQEQLEEDELQAAVQKAIQALPAALRVRVVQAIEGAKENDPLAEIGFAAIRAHLAAEGFWR